MLFTSRAIVCGVRTARVAGDVDDDGFDGNGVATAGSIDEEVARSADYDGVAISAEDATHHARKTARESVGCGLLFGIGHRLSAGGSELRQHLAGRVFSVANPRPHVVRAA